MNIIIKDIFGNAVSEQKYSFPAGTPFYVSAGYEVSLLIWEDRKCLLVRPTNQELTLPSIKKQVKKIESICNLPVIIDLERINSRQRTNLIESGIAFVSDTGQLFIPFWACYFEEKIRCNAATPEQMTDNAQLVYLHLFYMTMEEIVDINMKQLCEKLLLPKSTCSRAVHILETLDLIEIRNEGTAKWISLKQPLTDNMEYAEPFLSSPVHKTVYLKEMTKKYNCKIGGIRALSDMSMLAANESDGSYVINRDEFLKIPDAKFIDRQEYRDFGGVMLEVWKYDPSLLSDNDYVDDISLVLSLKDATDERVQKELDTIREKYGMQVE